MLSVDEPVLIISHYCVGFHPFKMDIVIIAERIMSPAIRENESYKIDYGFSLSLVVIDICLLHFLHIYFTLEKWGSGYVVNSFYVIPCAREEEGETRFPCTLLERRDSVLYR
jgi:hypothetical protein